MNNPSGTSMTTASFTWSDGETGGKVIDDYKIETDQAVGVWVQLATEVTEQVYTATGLASGLIYKFRVYARNSVGYGEVSDEVSILTAVVP